jgi:hypothetical protein
VIGIIAALTLAGFGTGRFIGWIMKRQRTPPVAAVDPPSPPTGDEAVARLVGFPCSLGDVVLLSQGDEAWLAGALLLRERAAERDEAGDLDRTVAVLFVAPDRDGDRAVYARGAPAPSLDWLFPIPEGALSVGPEPPSAIEHERERFERVCRIPLSVIRAGAGAPDLGADAVVAEYEGGAGARLLVIVGSIATRLWMGRRLEQGMYDVLPGK